MSLQERFAKFQKALPFSDIKFEEWKKLKQWSDVNPLVDKLDLSIFPDSLQSLEWESGAVRQIIIPESMTKLQRLDLNANHLDKVIVPDTVKLKNLSMNFNPLKKFKLGGSLTTIEHLILPEDMPVEKLRLPAGMTALKTFSGGSIVGGVVLPKDAVALEQVSLFGRPLDGKFKVPAELTAIKEVKVVGLVKLVAISPKAEALTSLRVDTAATEITLPRNLPALHNLRLDGASLKSVVIPNGLTTKLTELTISAQGATEVTLPKVGDELTFLQVNAGKANITVSKKLVNLNTIKVDAQNLTYQAKSHDLEHFSVSAAKEITVESAPMLTNLVSFHAFSEAKVAAKLPLELPKLATFAAPEGTIPEGAVWADKATVASTF